LVGGKLYSCMLQIQSLGSGAWWTKKIGFKLLIMWRNNVLKLLQI
jgi:hypothetical protein